MPAPEAFERIRDDVERALGSYVVRRCEQSGWRVVLVCPTGESHVGFFVTEHAAEAYLLTKLMQTHRR